MPWQESTIMDQRQACVVICVSPHVIPSASEESPGAQHRSGPSTSQVSTQPDMLASHDGPASPDIGSE